MKLSESTVNLLKNFSSINQSILFKEGTKLSNRPTGRETSSGIGLSMSKKLVDFHQGNIGARNNPDQGSTFWIKLPIDQTNA